MSNNHYNNKLFRKAVLIFYYNFLETNSLSVSLSHVILVAIELKCLSIVRVDLMEELVNMSVELESHTSSSCYFLLINRFHMLA